MTTEIIVPSPFLKEVRKLSKKYPAVITELEKFSEQLETDERPGDKVPGVGYDVYKVRLPNPSANRGKSGGFRVIYYVQLEDRVVLVTIYSKTQQSDIAPENIRRILNEVLPPDDDEE